MTLRELKLTVTEDQIEGLRQYVEWWGAAHAKGCPQDDTCDCPCKPLNAAVNSILSGAFDAQLRSSLSEQEKRTKVGSSTTK